MSEKIKITLGEPFFEIVDESHMGDNFDDEYGVFAGCSGCTSCTAGCAGCSIGPITS